jgi:hypothetical protein
MQAFVNWIGAYLNAFFDNLRLWFEGLWQFIIDWLVYLVVELVYPAMDAMCDFCSADLTSAVTAAHEVVSQYYPHVQWFIPIAEMTGIVMCYITVYFLLWPLKMLVRSLMQLL